MGNICCCCCCPDDEFRRQRQHQHQQHAGFRTAMPAYHATVVNQRANQNSCRICGKEVDPSLIDGHEESCRIQARRNLQTGAARDGVVRRDNNNNNNNSNSDSETVPLNPQQHQTASADNNDTPLRKKNDSNIPEDIPEDDSDRACVICLQNRKVCCILPCAHLCVCFNCSKMIDQCPLCRSKKESLLVINENAGKCRVCHNYIAPVYLDSHQEVCRLRMRELRKTLREESKKSAAQFAAMKSREGSTNFTPQVNEDDYEEKPSSRSALEMEGGAAAAAAEQDQKQQLEDLCLQCMVNKREKFYLPCGHSCCANPSCANKSVCSVCLQKVACTITVYD